MIINKLSTDTHGQRSQTDVIGAFRLAALEHGIELPTEIIADGKNHRFKIRNKQNGFYRLHLDGRAAGCFQDWKQHDKPILWKMDGYSRTLTDAERQQYAAQRRADEAQRQSEEAAKHAKAASTARYIWQNSTPVIEHPYLTRKRIQPHKTRINKHGALVLPLLNDNLELVNLQFINEDGTKRFLAGGKKKGCFWWIGKPTGTVLIAEGFATAASIYQDTGKQVFIAFDAGNLEPVAKVVRSKFPKAEIIVMSDNDIREVGQTKARSAALAVGGKYLVCPNVGQDFNDFLTQGA